MHEEKQKSFGEELIEDITEGLQALREGKPLVIRRVSASPEPTTFDQQRVRGLRERLGASPAGFARMLNVSEKTVQNWEKGLRRPSGATLRLLQVFEQPELVSQLISRSSASATKMPSPPQQTAR
jgi:putative transcriptional regulator